uniref:Mucin n=1 Tax=Toxocara canis TaxID=6265 RepID=A0A183U519_TOXCA
LAVNTTAKERIAKRFVYNVPPIPITLPKPELVDDTSTAPLEQRGSYSGTEHGVLVADKTDIVTDDSSSSIRSAARKSDVDERQRRHKTTAEMPTGNPDGTAVPTREETAMIEATRLSAFTSVIDGPVNHENASYSDDVLLSANDTSEARTKGSLPLRLNKMTLAVVMMLSTIH